MIVPKSSNCCRGVKRRFKCLELIPANAIILKFDSQAGINLPMKTGIDYCELANGSGCFCCRCQSAGSESVN
jgi:hypothetical protein